MNKNISVWRGILTPPTSTHLWIKDDKNALIYVNGQWSPIIQEATESLSGLMSKTDKQILNMLNKNMHWK